jgi:hypothetical protein
MTSAIIDCNNPRFNELFGDHVLKRDTPGRVEAAFGRDEVILAHNYWSASNVAP